MKAFRRASPELRLYYGPDCLRGLPQELDRMGCRRAVIFCGRTLAQNEHALNLVRNALGSYCVDVYCQVSAHSPLPSVEEGARLLARQAADCVVALGGGSAIVTARVASILLAEKSPAQALATQHVDGRLHSPKLLAAKLPQFVVVTTPTTASIKAGSASLDPATGRRLAFFDPKTRARALFVHPKLVQTAPIELMQSASLNALAMAVEGLESEACNTLVDALLIHALAVICEQLPRLRAFAGDAELRGQLALAAVLVGQGTDYAGGGVVSALGHAIAAKCHVVSGSANAVLLPHTMRFNAPATADRLKRVAKALNSFAPSAGRSSGDAAIAAVDALLVAVRAPRCLRELGVPRDALTEIAGAAMDDWFLSKNPRPVEGPAELITLLEAAW